MKKKILTWIAGCFITAMSFAATTPSAEGASYFVDDQQIETLFENSQDISLSAAAEVLNMTQGSNAAAMNNAQFASGDKNFVAAILLNFFLGGLGIHRLYLGTKTMTWIGYILTCGGIFGVVPLVDFIVLIINNDDLSPYIGNPKFFMWGGGNM